MLERLQFGGKRSYGYGITRLKDTQVVDLDDLDYSRLGDGEAFLVEVTTPFVLESEYPKAADQDVPWWWKESRRDLREREEKMLEQQEVYKLQTVDHGQVSVDHIDSRVTPFDDGEANRTSCGASSNRW